MGEKLTASRRVVPHVIVTLPLMMVLLTAGISTLKADDALPHYKDSTLSVETRVEDLVGRMTVEEKARQLDMYFGCEDFLDPDQLTSKIITRTRSRTPYSIPNWPRKTLGLWGRDPFMTFFREPGFTTAYKPGS